VAYSKDISDIIRALSESGFEDAEVRLDDLYIRVSSGSSGMDTGPDRSFCPPDDTATIRLDGGRRETTDPAPLPSALEEGGPVKDIKAPTLGTFYRAPSPGAPPFVKVGDRVIAGQTVGIVEVMKLFNAVEADVAGTVVAIHAEDGVLVEHDQPLITVRVG
jgi:acetyl-CoA carboxylase biotin carboxyl carrier protein